MASPKRNTAFTWSQPFFLNGVQVVSPPVAAGDAVVITAGVSTGNLNTLTGQTYGADCTASAAQMNGGDAFIVFADQTVPRAWDSFVVQFSLDAKNDDDLGTDIAGVQADTDNIQLRLPAALTAAGNLKADVEEWRASVPNALQSGRVDGYTGAMASGVIASVTFQAGAIDSSALGSSAASEIADAVAAVAIEGSVTLKQILQIIASAASGILSGAATTTVTIRDINNTRNCIVATVDANGNRSVVTYTVV